jgi:3-methyl-2-oxobutanoate hydroxymethyltransferase
MATSAARGTVGTPAEENPAAGGAGREALQHRITLQTLREKKQRREPIAMLTAYDYPTARILAAAGVDVLLVGDSAATTLLGAESTVAATLDFMLMLTAAVRRGAPDVLVMADMPFASYPDIPTGVASASRFVREGGADAVKFEVDIRHVEMIRAASSAGITVCAHVGLLPQRAAQQGGYVAQGRTPAEAQRIIDAAVAHAQAGAHLLLLEAVPDEVTAEVVRQVDCPVLGCGAGPSSDGHVVVIHDMLGYNARVPRFVERFGDVPAAIQDAAQRYIEAVRTRAYPAPHHLYRMRNS